MANWRMLNQNRMLSADTVMENVKHAKKMDAIYTGCKKEFGCLEIGQTKDKSKEWDDGYIKLPLIMKDQLGDIISTRPNISRDISVLGYMILSKYIILPQDFLTNM